MKTVLSQALAAIQPTREEHEQERAFAELLVSHIRENAPAGCEVVLTGSIAKGTFLRDKRDIDIFVLFGSSVPKEELEPYMKNIMDAAFPGVGYQLSYAEHPYVRFHFEGRRIDLVPAYKISKASERISAVDRSVLHTKFVLGTLKKGQVGDVLLLKQFLKANSLYGAEIKTAGLSGYLCELLIISHGSFGSFVKAAARWKTPVLIDIKKHYKLKDAKETITKFNSGLVVIDPTDKKRNVAAAVSAASLKNLIAICRAFVKKPSPDSFFRKPETFEEKVASESGKGAVFLVSMPRPDVVDDILWGQLHKMAGQLEASLKEFGPKKILADDSRHIVRLAIILKKDKLPEKMLVAGPPLSMKGHAIQFRKSHKKSKFMIRKGKIWAEVRRPVTGAQAAIADFFRTFANTKSHLAYPAEMIVIERLARKTKRQKGGKIRARNS